MALLLYKEKINSFIHTYFKTLLTFKKKLIKNFTARFTDFNTNDFYSNIFLLVGEDALGGDPLDIAGGDVIPQPITFDSSTVALIWITGPGDTARGWRLEFDVNVPEVVPRRTDVVDSVMILDSDDTTLVLAILSALAALATVVFNVLFV